MGFAPVGPNLKFPNWSGLDHGKFNARVQRMIICGQAPDLKCTQLCLKVKIFGEIAFGLSSVKKVGFERWKNEKD